MKVLFVAGFGPIVRDYVASDDLPGVKHVGLWTLAEAAEEWGQTVARLLSPEGLLVGVTVTPWMREGGEPAKP